MVLPVIRYYCLISMGDGPFLGLDYLQAIDQSGLGVRACPIGAALLTCPPWDSLIHLFTGLVMSDRYVNVVCAPLCYPLGAPTTGADFAGLKGDPAVVYQPLTALAGLYTVGVPNVAITLPHVWEGANVTDDVQALEKYDLVICPTKEDAAGLKDLGVTAIVVPPSAAELGKALSALLG